MSYTFKFLATLRGSSRVRQVGLAAGRSGAVAATGPNDGRCRLNQWHREDVWYHRSHAPSAVLKLGAAILATLSIMSEQAGTFWALQQAATQGLCLLQATAMALTSVKDALSPCLALAQRSAESVCSAEERQRLALAYRAQMDTVTQALDSAHSADPPLLCGTPLRGAQTVGLPFSGGNVPFEWPNVSLDSLALAAHDVETPSNATLAFGAVTAALRAVASMHASVGKTEAELKVRVESWSRQHIRRLRGYGAFESPDHARAAVCAAVRAVANDVGSALAAQANISPEAAEQLLTSAQGSVN
jgi:hypothetical protein